VTTMYPEGASVGTRVQVPALEGMLCARSRPHHFTGVATVVNRMFNMAQPDVALFGKKDYQQLLVISQMARDLSMEVEVCGVETVRDQHGLALSSRNGYLSAEQRLQAAGLQRVLRETARRILAGETDYPALEAAAEQALAGIGMQPEYVSVRVQQDLREPAADDQDLVVLAAARLGPARLIDNIEVSRG
jgi:pantoate--beta-alanine ligase